MSSPVIVRNSRVDYLSANALGRALYAPLFDSLEQPANSARFTFLDPAAHDFYVDWERTAKDLVAHLRSEAGRNPYDRDLSNLVGELSTRSHEFRTWWAAHNVRYHQSGTKRLRHPVVGELELSYEVMELSADRRPSAPTGRRRARRLLGLTPPSARQPGEPAMQITRSTIDTQKGPADWFTGDVYIDAVAAPAGTSTFAAASVHFTPGARTAWHVHPHGQTIYVTEGIGLCQREGGPVEVISPGDRVFFEPGENHWHGAAPNRLMVHIAMQQNDDSGSPVTWGRHVSDDEYAAAPSADS